MRKRRARMIPTTRIHTRKLSSSGTTAPAELTLAPPLLLLELLPSPLLVPLLPLPEPWKEINGLTRWVPLGFGNRKKIRAIHIRVPIRREVKKNNKNIELSWELSRKKYNGVSLSNVVLKNKRNFQNTTIISKLKERATCIQGWFIPFLPLNKSSKVNFRLRHLILFQFNIQSMFIKFGNIHTIQSMWDWGLRKVITY